MPSRDRLRSGVFSSGLGTEKRSLRGGQAVRMELKEVSWDPLGRSELQ